MEGASGGRTCRERVTLLWLGIPDLPLPSLQEKRLMVNFIQDYVTQRQVVFILYISLLRLSSFQLSGIPSSSLLYRDSSLLYRDSSLLYYEPTLPLMIASYCDESSY